MPKKDVGLSCVVSRNGESVIVILGNEDGATTGLDCDAKKLRQIIITLLMAAGVAAQRSGRRPPPNQVPRDISDRPLPLTEVGLLPSPAGQADILYLSIGEVQFGFQLSTDTLRTLGQAMIAASAEGSKH